MSFVTTGLTHGGLTTHYQIEYDDSLSQADGKDRANALIAKCESDFDLMSHWFGGIALTVRTPVTLQIKPGPGASAAWGPPITLQPGNGSSIELVRYLLVAEVTEMFMMAQNKGWFGAGNEGSAGEGLSRFLANQFLIANGLANADPGPLANFWMNSPRADYVNNVDVHDHGGDAKTGCAILFIYYLNVELGFSVNRIVAAAAPELAGVYKNLTGDNSDPFPSFKQLLDSFFPGTTTIPGTNPDNPFPLVRKWFQIHPETVFDHTTQKIAAVSRATGNLDLFVIGFDNAVWTTFWTQGGGWNPGGWFQIHPETVFDHTTQKIAAVSRAAGNLDLFVIGFDNVVWTTFWTQGGGWNPGGWFQLHPETVFDHTTQKIAAVSRTAGNLDLFVIGFDNVIWTTFWTQGGGWNPGGWFQLHPETVFDHTTQKIAAVSRAAGNLDLFVIGFDNAVWTTFWTQGGGWNPGGWFQLHPATVFDHTTQKIAAVSRAAGNLDLFVIGFDNAVWTTFWTQGGGWNPGGWFQLHPETVFDHTTQKIAAVSRATGNLDLFVIGFDNAVWTTFWTQAGGWNPGGWFQIHPEMVFDHTTQEIAAVSRAAGNLDLFVIGFDNAVWNTYWAQHGGWDK